MGYFRKNLTAISNLGLRGWALYQFRKSRLKQMRRNELFSLTSKYAGYPVLCRAHSSDIDVFYTIFIKREYSCLDDITEAGLIIDCGAYVGYSSVYFLSRFPRCDLIAVEPDPENFELLCLNLSHYGHRASLLQAAVWSHPTKLKLSEAPYRDGREWSRQVRECKSEEGSSFPAVDIESLLQRSGHDRVSILKIDIEGSEAVVFSDHHATWIDRVDNIVIEIHDDSVFGHCSAVFARAIANREFNVSRSGELTVCRRRA